MATDNFNLQRLLDHELTSSDIEKVIETFETVLQSLSDANFEEQAQKMASRLQEEVSPDKPDSQFVRIWETIFSVARHVPHRDEQKQEFMVRVIQILVPTPPWTGVPLIGMIMRDNWNHSPVFEDPEERDPEDDQTFTFDQWLNLNSFCARLLKAGLVRTPTFVLWEMRSGLERELSPDAETDCQLCVASEWVIQAAPALLRQCLEDIGFEKEADERAHSPGPLFKGRAGLHLEHWGFWKRRFGEVRSIATSEQAIASIDEAVRCMTAAEKAFAEAELK